MALNHATSPVGEFSVFKRIKKFYAELRREFVTKSTSGGCGQFETSPEAIEPQLLKLFCERRQTDRLKTNYRVDKKIWGEYLNWACFSLPNYIVCDDY